MQQILVFSSFSKHPNVILDAYINLPCTLFNKTTKTRVKIIIHYFIIFKSGLYAGQSIH